MKKAFFLLVTVAGFTSFGFAQTEKSTKEIATDDARPLQYDPNQSKAVKVDEGVPVSKTSKKTEAATIKKKDIFMELALGDDQIHMINEVNKATAMKKANIDQNGSLSAEKKQAELKKIEEAKTTRLKQVLGDKYERYIKATSTTN